MFYLVLEKAMREVQIINCKASAITFNPPYLHLSKFKNIIL
jgi:hypothetical protein